MVVRRGASSAKAVSPSKSIPSPTKSKSRENKTSAGIKKNAVAKKPRKKNPVRDIVGLFKNQKIPVYRPGGEEYQRSIATANLFFRFSRPAFVVQPESAAHVKYIVKQAKAQNIPMTIKNGGHSYSGSSTANKGISLDLE
jgi:hypothetical protein